jgi:hypothetical protein
MITGNIVIRCEKEKKYYASCIEKINEALVEYEKKKKVKDDSNNLSRGYKFFKMSKV